LAHPFQADSELKGTEIQTRPSQ